LYIRRDLIDTDLINMEAQKYPRFLKFVKGQPIGVALRKGTPHPLHLMPINQRL